MKTDRNTGLARPGVAVGIAVLAVACSNLDGITNVDIVDVISDAETDASDESIALPPLDAALASLDAAPAGFAGFAFIVNDVVQQPMICPSQDWTFSPYPASSAGMCSSGCPGVQSAILVNTGALPLPYVAGSAWIAGAQYPPGVMTGGMSQIAGVLPPGGTVDFTSLYQEGVSAAVGSAQPFSLPDSGYVSDEGTIPWPSGVAGSGGAATMYVAEIVVQASCGIQSEIW
jgi:hypothetical protein